MRSCLVTGSWGPKGLRSWRKKWSRSLIQALQPSRRSTRTICRSLRRSKPSPSVSTAPTKFWPTKKIRNQLREWEDAGYGNLPVCMAKTQYSFSTDPNLRGAPVGHSVPVREVRLSAGAGFIVVVCGEIMTMPGLPRKPASESIRLNDEGLIEGLF